MTNEMEAYINSSNARKAMILERETTRKNLEQSLDEELDKLKVNFNFNDEKDCLEAVKTNGAFLYYVKNQTHEICMEAIKNNPLSIGFVIDQSPELCKEAVERDRNAIFAIRDSQTVLSLKYLIHTI